MNNVYETIKQITTLNTCYFSTSKQMNIRLLQTEYYEYTNVGFLLKKKYPDYKDNYSSDEYTHLSEQMKHDFKSESKKQILIRERLIFNAQTFCKNYPDENLCSNIFLKEYKEYPYRLHQNMETIIEDLQI